MIRLLVLAAAAALVFYCATNLTKRLAPASVDVNERTLIAIGVTAAIMWLISKKNL